ncbi:MAG: pseudaminic acid synthase [Proteobacteria bacterium]|nr:pseudaminic acid synthase [Pseudomonadota bacterium]
MAEPFSIDGRSIGPEHPPYIVAEMSGNHNGQIDRAIRLIDAAKQSGADAVKLQTYTADTITIDHDGPGFVLEGGLWDGRRLYELYQEAHTPWEWHERLFEHARQIGITLFSAPFDPTAIDLLESLNTPAYKIASPEIVDLALIETCAATGKPLIISSGMASFEEISEAVATASAAGATQILVLHCISAYPTPLDQAHLSTIGDLSARLGAPVGLSDHTLDTFAAAVAVGQGAVLIEKHFTLARADGGVDSAFSLEPDELKRLVEDSRAAHAALGRPNYRPNEAEQGTLIARRSLYVVADIRAGEALTPANVRSIRPNLGLAPRHLKSVLGKTAARDLTRGAPLAADMVHGLKL